MFIIVAINLALFVGEIIKKILSKLYIKYFILLIFILIYLIRDETFTIIDELVIQLSKETLFKLLL